MRVLFTGRGTSGSWQIRGEQIAGAFRALGVDADAVREARNVSAYDVAVIVKRAPPDLLDRVHRAGVHVVWDVVDSWPQPDGNAWGRAEAVHWLRQRAAEVRPDRIVAATQQMADDVAEIMPGVPCLALPHHARPGLAPVPLREQVRTVVYEGSERHLGWWDNWLTGECMRLGLQFLRNPPEGLTVADVVVAFRERTGYPATRWKSNVKQANAQAAGLPFVAGFEAGYAWKACGAELMPEGPPRVYEALARLAAMSLREREEWRQLALSAAPRLETVAQTYARWILEGPR